jgi:hypothetical protein
VVIYYNTARPHQALNDAPPAERFGQPDQGADTVDQPPRLAAQASAGHGGGADRREPLPSASSGRDGDGWVSRKVRGNGIVCVGWQQVSVGKHRAGQRCDVLVSDQLLQFWIGDELMKTVTRTSSGEVRKKHAQGSRAQG